MSPAFMFGCVLFNVSMGCYRINTGINSIVGSKSDKNG